MSSTNGKKSAPSLPMSVREVLDALAHNIPDGYIATLQSIATHQMRPDRTWEFSSRFDISIEGRDYCRKFTAASAELAFLAAAHAFKQWVGEQHKGGTPS